MLSFKKIKKAFQRYIYASKSNIRILLAVNIIILPLTFVSPKLYQILIDDVMSNKQLSKLWIVCVGMVVLYIIQTLFEYVKQHYENKVNKIFNMSVRKDVWNKMLNLSFMQKEKFSVGDVKQRIVDEAEKIGNFIKEQIVDRYYNYFLVIVGTILIIFINPTMALICAVMVPVLLLINDYIGRKSSEVNGEIRKISDEYYGFTYNSLQFWREIKLQNAENSFIDKFTVYRHVFSKLGLKSIKYWSYGEVFNDFKTNYLSRVIVYLIGIFFVIKGKLTVGTLVMFVQYFEFCFNALDIIISKNIDIKKNNPYYTRLIEALDLSIDNEGDLSADLNCNISVNDLCFSYGDHQVINNCSFEIYNGDSVVIVGESGCGKTTLVKLLIGMIKADKGEIQYSSININNISKNSFYNQIGIVMQDPFFFNLTIKENLQLSKINATQEEMERVCKLTCIFDYISSLPDGFNTLIGENGLKLSGGQKQRLAIAQALLKKPKILFLDEATSALDESNEKAIMNNIQLYHQDMTVVLISHKPSVIKLMDKKINLSKNKEYVYE